MTFTEEVLQQVQSCAFLDQLQGMAMYDLCRKFKDGTESGCDTW